MIQNNEYMNILDLLCADMFLVHILEILVIMSPMKIILLIS
jgi:hypothetical protein